MKKREAISFVLNRLGGSFTLKNGTQINQLNREQSRSEHIVRIIRNGVEVTRGGWENWDNDHKWMLSANPSEFPDDESATLHVVGKNLVLVVEYKDPPDTKTDYAPLAGAYKYSTKKYREVLCPLSDIIWCAGDTTSGWEFSLYPERKDAGTDWNSFVGILFRSDGSVTLVREKEDFPF